MVKAAPVKWDQEIVYNHPGAQAVICNSGIANACTGEEGYGYCKEQQRQQLKALKIPADRCSGCIYRCYRNADSD